MDDRGLDDNPSPPGSDFSRSKEDPNAEPLVPAGVDWTGISENVGCTAAAVVALLVAGVLCYVWLRQPNPSVECVRAGGTWAQPDAALGHCEKAKP